MRLRACGNFCFFFGPKIVIILFPSFVFFFFFSHIRFFSFFFFFFGWSAVLVGHYLSSHGVQQVLGQDRVDRDG